MDSSPRGDLENGSASAVSDELWQWLQAAMMITESSASAEGLIDALLRGVAIREQVVVVRRGIAVVMNIIVVVVVYLRVVEAVLAEFLVVVLVGGGGGTQLLTVGLMRLAWRRHRA